MMDKNRNDKDIISLLTRTLLLQSVYVSTPTYNPFANSGSTYVQLAAMYVRTKRAHHYSPFYNRILLRSTQCTGGSSRNLFFFRLFCLAPTLQLGKWFF